ETTLVNTLVKAQADLINTLGAAVELKEGITVTGGLEYRSSDVARTQFTVAQKGLPGLTKLLAEKTGLTFEQPADENNPPGFGPGGMPLPPGMGPGDDAQTPGGPRGMGRQMGRGFPGPGGRGFPGGQPAPGGLAPGQPPQPGEGGGEPPPTKSSLVPSLESKMIVVLATFALDSKAHDTLMTSHVLPEIVKRRGAMEMAAVSPARVHEVAQSFMAYREGQKQFPRGTADRPVPSTRVGRPFPANDRVSLFADLLPFLGHSDLHSRIDF